ncbi:conserved hypothetical protein [Crenothrix polyspora]|uniref:TIGR03016 family PEP-CTERM system-associated outer membrane protein n=1 Tax=Crenothrix polyspora TaxID=360316 RepID=A0A1R4HFV0_9GAMM|nr:TIGR03016 family PEP-CTERM system-associated outer membrane protein [Crenothrix polyspora]SJM95103.1 conserved hypothetical protein [Crenothrix polyspora]
MLKKNIIFLKGLVICVFYQSPLYAHNWRLTPSIQLQEIYSDNINLASADKAKSALVTSLSPAALIIWRVGKSSLNLRYTMQNLYNAQGNGDVTVFHQLQFNAHNVLSQNRLFVDSRSSIGQQNISNTRLASDNLSGRTTTVTTFGISPTWLPHFGNYANGTVRVNADTFSSGANTSATGGLSDSETVSEIVQFNSGSKFKRIRWSAGFNNSQTYRTGGGDVSFQNSSVTLRTYLDKHFSVFATGGHSANHYVTQINGNPNSNNGFFYTFGGRWSPSTHYWLEAGGGNNSYATVNISPMQRLSWLTTVRHNNIGLNSGTTWQTALNYRTRKSNWSLTHNNSTTTAQNLLSQTGTGEPVIPINNTILTNDIIVVQSSNLSASYYSGKSTFSLSGYLLDYAYQLDPLNQQNQIKDQNIKGISGLWNWQFARKTSAYIRPLWQQIDTTYANNIRSQGNRYDFAIGLNQTITNRISGNLELRHVTQTSNAASTLLNSDYQENRATANLFMRF